MSVGLLDHFPAGFTPRPQQRRLLAALDDALAEAADDPAAARLLLVEAPPGVGKSHVALTLARWSGDAYLLTSQKLLQDQYEREFGPDLQLVKGRDNYACELYPGVRVPTTLGLCRRRPGLACPCPYARAKAAALAGPIFCTNTAYFVTLRHWHREHLRRRRLLVIDEAHTLEGQLVSVFTVSFTHDQMRRWFGGPLPRLADAAAYAPVMEPHLERLAAERDAVERALAAIQPAGDLDALLRHPPSREEGELVAQRELLDAALARLRFFLDGRGDEWVVRYPAGPEATLELAPLSITAMARELLADCADVAVLSSAYLGHRALLAESFGLDTGAVRGFAVGSPFPLEQRRIVYRPVGALSHATLARLEPRLFQEVATILDAHPTEKGLIHAPSYAVGQRLVDDLARRAPRAGQRLIWVASAAAKAGALEAHRASTRPTVLLSPSLREGVDLPDDFLRFQIITKVPYPDLGDPWTAARARDRRWYAVETAKALVQAYGRSCRHAGDHGTTYVLDAQLERFLAYFRVVLPAWFVEAAESALRAWRRGSGRPAEPEPD